MSNLIFLAVNAVETSHVASSNKLSKGFVTEIKFRRSVSFTN